MDKREFLGTMALTAFAAAFPTVSNAQRQIAKIVVPFSAGGSTDTLARLMAEGITAPLDETIIVENKPGASGMIAASYVAKSTADGQTILLGSSPLLATNPTLFKESINYDVAKDFTPVILATTLPCVVVVPESSPYKTLPDLLNSLKKEGKHSYGSAGNGTIPHFGAEMLKQMTGIKAQHVPYKGGAPALTDLAAGLTTFSVAVLPDATALIQAGRLRPLAVSTRSRIPMFPDVPTVAEYVKGYELAAWYGFVVPAATPPDMVSRLNAAFNHALDDPKARKRLDDMGFNPEGGSPQKFARFIASETQKLDALIASAHIRIE